MRELTVPLIRSLPIRLPLHCCIGCCPLLCHYPWCCLLCHRCIVAVVLSPVVPLQLHCHTLCRRVLLPIVLLSHHHPWCYLLCCCHVVAVILPPITPLQLCHHMSYCGVLLPVVPLPMGMPVMSSQFPAGQQNLTFK